MLTLKAKLIGVYKANDFKNDNGEVTTGKTKLQLQTTRTMKDGGSKVELLDISVPNEKVAMYRSKIGQDVTVDVAVVGKVSYYGI